MYDGTSLADMHRTVATYADRILKGAKPADLTVEIPTELELPVNLKAVKAPGFTVPQTVFLQTSRAIEQEVGAADIAPSS